jgi:TonB family protein
MVIIVTVRSLLVVSASVILHASAATAGLVFAGGHARVGTANVASLEIDVAVEETPAPVVQEEQPKAREEIAANTPAPTHTHDYPVPPSHDARPHDPRLVHHAHDDDDHHDAPAQAAPALTGDDTSALPHFKIAIGGGQPTGGAVSQSGTGTGAAAAPSVAPAPTVVHTPSGVSVQARPLGRPDPVYPASARADDREGEVGLEIVVDENGSVIDAHVARPAGYGFDDSALAAIRRLRFSPAQKDGHAVRVRMPWSIQFRLR